MHGLVVHKNLFFVLLFIIFLLNADNIYAAVAPEANDQSVTTAEDMAKVITLVATDGDGDPLTYSVVTPPAHGTLSGTAPDLIYTPEANYNGPDSYIFKANDGTADSASATVSLTVTAVNDDPVTNDQSVSTDRNTAKAVTLAASDVDGDTLTYSVVTQPSHGALSGTAPNLTYTPTANYNGSDSFTFNANDGTVDSNTATVSVTVNASNDVPVANGQSVTTAEDTAKAITLTGSDADGDPLTYSVVTPPAHGTLSGTAPNLTYTPAANYNGPDSFTFEANDGTVDSNTATVSITVDFTNDAPVANGQSVTTAEDTAKAIILTGNDADGDSLIYSIVTPPAHGTLSGTAPNLTYTPAANFNGSDSFTFKVNDGTVDSASATVSITVTAVNDAPAANGQSVSTNRNTAKSVTLTATDVDGNTLTYSVVTQPSHGTLFGTASNLTYTPSTAYSGSDSFTFKANDGTVDSAAATVSITVDFTNVEPEADDQSVSTAEDTAKAIILTGSDADGDSLIYSVVTQPAHGTLSGTVPNLTYTPAANYNGPDSFTFEANDGTVDSASATVSITVTAANDAPVANGQSITTTEDTVKAITLTGSDVDGNLLTYSVVTPPAHGTLSGTVPNLTYTPAANYNGTDSFTFKANDGTVDSNTATVSITVDFTNDAPAANPQSVTTAEDTAKAITLTGSDTDGDPLTYNIVTSPAHGTLSGTAPNLTYTPAANYNAPDNFTFKVNDGTVDSASATVSITVTAVNDAPVATAQSVSTSRNSAKAITLTATDVDANTLTYSVVAAPTHGTLSGTAPNLTYTPATAYSGLDSFTFKANDGTIDSAPATVSITVSFTNVAPEANTQSVTTAEDTAKAITLAGSDADGDTLTYSVVAALTHGALSGTAPNLTYTPTANYNGSDSFTFKANDGTVDSATATVSITVTAANDAPVAQNGTLTTDEDTAATESLVATDIDSTSLTYSIVSQGSKGTVTITNAATGAYSYTPNVNANGSDSFTFKANDGSLDSNTATVTVTITAVNDVPTAPTRNSPPDGSPNVNEITTLTPTLVGNNATDLDGDTLSYIFEIDTVNTFSSANKKTSPSVAEGAGTTSWSTSALTDNTTWYWRAKANDGLANGQWMTTGSFFINTANNAPTAPTLNSPLDNGRVSTFTPTLTVNAATDIDYDTLKYEFAVYSDISLNPQTQIAGATDQGTSWTVDPPLENLTTYYWTARAKDQHNYLSPWMAAKSFYVDDNGVNDPPTITIDVPRANEPPTNTTSFTIRWTDTDPDSNATINLYYDNDNNGYNGTQVVTSIQENDSSNSYTWNTSALPGGNYYIYGMIKDEITTVYAYSAGPLVIDRTPPSAPAVSGTTPTNNTTPVWSWSTGGGSGNGTYRYKLDDSNLATGTTETTATSFTPASAQSQGAHTLYVQERDAAGNWSANGSFAIVVDTTAPTAPVVTSTTPTNDTTPTWSWSAGGGGGNGTYRYKLDDNNLATGATETTTTTFTPVAAQSQGTHTLYVQERDAAGNWSANGSFAIVMDTTAPTAPVVSGTTPTNDTTPTWSWSAGGGGNGTYRYKLDDSNLATGATETTTTSFTPVSAQSQGTHTLYVQERTAAGNWSESGSFAIVIDTTAPTTPSVTGTTPTNDTTPTWSWSTGGGGGNGTYRYKLDDNNLSTGATETMATSFSPPSAQSQVAHTLYVQERDAAGNWSANGSFAIVVDTTAPTVPLVTGTTPTNDTTPTWNWTAGGGGNGTYRYKLDDNNLATGATETTATTFTPTAVQSEGSHTLYVQERDAAGNWSAIGSFAIIVDTTASTEPIVTGTTPTNDTIPTWSWSTGGGNGTYRYKLDDSDLTTGTTETTATTFTPAAVQSEGTHTLYVQERDTAGNWSANGSFAIVVDTSAPTAPSVTGTTPTNGTTPTWSWSSGGGGGNGTYRYKLDNTDLATGATETTAATFAPTSAQSQGSHNLYVQERDTAGNWSVSGSFAIVVDITAPTAPSVTGTTPTNDTTPTWSWSAGGGGGNGTYRYKLDNSDLAAGATETTATTFSPALVQSQGSHTLYVQERDAAGNWSANGSFAIVIDLTAPNTTINSIVVNSTNIYPIPATVTFSEVVTGFELGDIVVSNGTAAAFTGSGASYTFSVTPAANGTVTIDIAAGVAQDAAGNSNTAASRFSRTYDSIAPNLADSASYVDSTHVEVTFSEVVVGANIPANYTAPGLSITGAALQSANIYRLTTSLQTVGTSYTITAANIIDTSGNALSNSADKAIFTRPSDSNSAPSIPTLNAPASGTPNVNEVTTLTPTLNANTSTDPDNDPITYTFEISASSDFSTIWAANSGITASSGVASWTVSPALADDTIYYWRVRANDGYRNSGDMSSATFFVNTANDAPPGIAVSSPANNTEVTSLTPVLTVTNGADVDKDSLTYELDVATDGNFTNIVANVTGIVQRGSGTTTWTVPTGKLSDNTLYFWRCRAKDQHGLAGNWVTATFVINRANDAPTAPTVNTPSNGTPNVNEVDTLTPTLVVNNATDPDRDTTLVYTFDIDTINTFNSVNKKISPLIAEGSGTTSWIPPTLSDNTTWYWRVKATDTHNADGPWMTIGSFFVNTANDAPNVPILVSPSNNGEVSSLTPTLSVSATDLDKDAIQCTFEIYSDSLLTKYETGAEVSGTNWTVAANTPLTDNTRYYWRAKAKDELGFYSMWMATSSFIVKNKADNQSPSIEITAPGAAEPVTNVINYTIRWSAADPDSPAFITLYYDNDNSGNNGTQIVAGISKDVSSYAWNTSVLIEDGSYYIYAKIEDGKTTVYDYSAGPLVIDRTAPPPPVVTGAALTNSATPTWNWSSGGNGGNGTYRYKLDSDNLATGSTETPAMTYTPATALSSATHTLYVQERDVAGNWSSNGSFAIVVDLTPPAAEIISGVPTSPTNITSATLTVGGTGVVAFKYKIDAGDWSGDTNVTNPISLSSLGNGLHTVYVTGRDSAGNWQAAANATIVSWTVDITPPGATISGNPSDPTNIPSATLSVRGTGVVAYKYAVDTGAYSAERVVSETISLTSLTDGLHTVSVIGRDNVGNWQAETEATTVSWTVDLTPPAFKDSEGRETISTLSDGAFTNQSTLNITGRIIENIGLLTLVIKVDASGASGASGVTFDALNNFSHAVELRAGANVITITVTDRAGNKASDVRTVNYDPNGTKLVIDAPADGLKTNRSDVAVTGSTGETSTVTMKVNSGVAEITSKTGTSYSATAYLVLGLNTIELTATDLDLKTNTLKRTVTFDDQKPTLSITEPAEDTREMNYAMTVKGTVADTLTPVTVTIRRYTDKKNNDEPDDSDTFNPTIVNGEFVQALMLTADKVNHIVATARDEAGNETTVQRNILRTSMAPDGDIDGSNHIDFADALLALQIAMGQVRQTDSYILKGDLAPLVNGRPKPDGKINLGDAVIILQVVMHQVFL